MCQTVADVKISTKIINCFNIGNGLAYVVIYFALVNDKPMKNTAI